MPSSSSSTPSTTHMMVPKKATPSMLQSYFRSKQFKRDVQEHAASVNMALQEGQLPAIDVVKT